MAKNKQFKKQPSEYLEPNISNDFIKNETKQKNYGNSLLYVIITLVIILIVGAIILVNQNKPSIHGNVVNSQQSNQNTQNSQANSSEKLCSNIQVPYDYIEEYQETIPYTDRECETKNLIYSATNDKWNYAVCHQWSKKCDSSFLGIPTDCTDFCADKSLSYSVDINNLDENQGSWTVNINLYKQGNLYKTVPINQFLYPKTTKTFNGIIRVTADSPNGDANQDYSAGYNVLYIPTKQVCRDVTKYKEVTKIRTLKGYRTEQQCG